MTVCTLCDKIQGDGRKFLDRFKSYFGSQISSQSLNDVHIYRLQPKSAPKGDSFHIFLSLIVSSRRQRADSRLELTIIESKTKIYEKNHILLRILSVIGIYVSHLTIVMIFVTQNNC